MCWPTDHPKKPVTGWVKCAPSLQSLHLAHLVHTLWSANGIHMHALCTLYADLMQTFEMHTLCTLSAHLGIDCSDLLHTQICRLKKCAPSLLMHTLCIHYMQTFCTPSRACSKSVHWVCRCTLDAYILKTKCILSAYPWVYFNLCFWQTVFSSNRNVMHNWSELISLIKSLDKKYDLKYTHTFSECMHTMCTL